MEDSYALVYTEAKRRVFVIISSAHGKFILTKKCAGDGCRCVGCVLLTATVHTSDGIFPVLDIDGGKQFKKGLIVYTFTEQGEMFLEALDRPRYAPYLGPIGKADLDKLFDRPNAVIIIGQENDGTFTHSFVSATVERVISRGCKATPHCPCVGCRIVDMQYTERPGHFVPLVDIPSRRATADDKLILPIFVDDRIVSALLNRDSAIRHSFTPNLFGSPLERMFYELAFLDLHLYPQHRVGKYRLDFAIPDKMIAIELDGHEYHKTKYQRTHDAQRDRWLYGLGWHVLRFTGTEIYKDLDGCIDEICRLANVERLNSPS